MHRSAVFFPFPYQRSIGPTRILLLLPLLLLILSSCSSKPSESLFRDNIDKMMLIDRELGFSEDISSITIVKVVKHPDQVEVEVKVEGWATHPEISIGAVLPASPAKRLSWSTWKFYCAEKGDTWTIIEKYKVDEGFMG